MALQKKTPLASKDYSFICRILSRSIEEFTLHPHPDSVKFVVTKFLDKYPSAVINENADTLVSLVNLLSLISENTENLKYISLLFSWHTAIPHLENPKAVRR